MYTGGTVSRRGCLLACLLALIGCQTHEQPPALPPAHLPYWRVAQPASRAVGCASLDAWVSKSGKSGLGLTVQLRPREQGCAAELSAATLIVAGQRISATAIGTGEYRYLPFLFDNDVAWRAGVRDATVELVLHTGGPAATTTVALQQVGLQPHHGVLEFHQTRAGCARVDGELLDLNRGAVVLRLGFEAVEPGCRVRFAGMTPGAGRSAPALAPAGDVWYALPARWVLGFGPGEFVAPKSWWDRELLVATPDGQTHPIGVTVTVPFNPWPLL